MLKVCACVVCGHGNMVVVVKGILYNWRLWGVSPPPTPHLPEARGPCVFLVVVLSSCPFAQRVGSLVARPAGNPPPQSVYEELCMVRVSAQCLLNTRALLEAPLRSGSSWDSSGESVIPERDLMMTK